MKTSSVAKHKNSAKHKIHAMHKRTKLAIEQMLSCHKIDKKKNFKIYVYIIWSKNDRQTDKAMYRLDAHLS